MSQKTELTESDWVALRLLIAMTKTASHKNVWEFNQYCKALTYLTKKYGDLHPYIEQLEGERHKTSN